MQLQRRISLFLVTILALLSGCQALYNPSLPQVPLMMGGDETQVALNLSNAGYGMQLAYSPYYHWVITANGNTFTVIQDTATDLKYRSTQGELGTGFYHCLDRNWRMEAIVGLGGGNAGIESDRNYFRKVFFQPSVGISGALADVGLTTRLTYVQHSKEKTSTGSTRLNEGGLFFDPSFMIRAGFEQVKFNFQVGWNIPLSRPSFSYKRVVAGAGVHITLFRDFDRFK